MESPPIQSEATQVILAYYLVIFVLLFIYLNTAENIFPDDGNA